MDSLRPTAITMPQRPGFSWVSFRGIRKLTAVYNWAELRDRSIGETANLPTTGELKIETQVTVAGLNPTSWLLFGPASDVAQITTDLKNRFQGDVLETDLSHSRYYLELTLDAAKELFGAYSSIDFQNFLAHPTCTTTRFADIRVFVANLGKSRPIVVMFDHSVANYMAGLIEHPK